jgi:hypothetical protein
MQTSDGFQDITHDFQDDVGGRLEFVEYRIEPEFPDSRLHVESGGSWRDHREAFAQQNLAQQRKDRLAARTDGQYVQPDAAKIQQARRLNNEFAVLKKPNGRGVGLIIGKE